MLNDESKDNFQIWSIDKRHSHFTHYPTWSSQAPSCFMASSTSQVPLSKIDIPLLLNIVYQHLLVHIDPTLTNPI